MEGDRKRSVWAAEYPDGRWRGLPCVFIEEADRGRWLADVGKVRDMVANAAPAYVGKAGDTRLADYLETTDLGKYPCWEVERIS